MRQKLAKVAWLSILLGMLAPVFARAEQPAASEYQVKAAFLYNFAKFVRWPDTAFPETNSPLVIGILGDNPFGQSLDLAVKGKSINGHPLAIRPVTAQEEMRGCHVLFICQKPKRNIPETLNALDHACTLTVSDTSGFYEAGGMIHFVMEGTKVRFEINDQAATHAGLSISSKLLSVARRHAREGT